MSKTDWSFDYSANISVHMNCRVLTDVLGQRMWVPREPVDFLIRNVNLLWYSGDGEGVYILAKQGDTIKIDIDEELLSLYNYFRAEPNKTFLQKGAIGINSAVTSATCEYSSSLGVTREYIKNALFDLNLLKNKAEKKKMLKTGENVADLYFSQLAFYGRPANMTGIYDWETQFEITGINGFCYYAGKNHNSGKRPSVKMIEGGFYKIDDVWPFKINNKGTYSFNDLITNKVYDSDDALSLVTVDIYQYNGLMSIYFSSMRNEEYTAEQIQAFGKLRWNDLIIKTSAEIAGEGSLYTSRGFGREITFSQKAINETMGFPVGVLAISANGVGVDIENFDSFAGYALIKIIDGQVADAKYNIDHYNIKIVIHANGELPPSEKPDDENNDNNSVNGDNPPSGNTPSDPSEIGVNLLTTTYLLTKTQLNTLGNELWSPNFMQNVLMLSNSPIENILSCKIFPTTFSGTASALKIGNVTMLSGANVQKISASGLSKDTGAINFPQLYNSFLDFEPFTQARIFIPFVGFQPLPVANFIGAQISLRYVFDVVTGAVSVYLLRNGYIFDKYSGICAVDVPLTASNRAQVEVGQIQSAITGVAQLATGNIGGALSAGLAIASTPNHFNTRGNAGGYTSQFDPRQPYLIIDRPKAQSEISSYGETNGFPCNLTKTLSELKGFTSVHDIHLDNVPCLESERQELKSIMQKGFVI